MTKFVWIPEAPEHPGVYAPNDYSTPNNTATYSPNDAMSFDTQDECQAWCEANPHPVFAPAEHGFCE